MAAATLLFLASVCTAAPLPVATGETRAAPAVQSEAPVPEKEKPKHKFPPRALPAVTSLPGGRLGVTAGASLLLVSPPRLSSAGEATSLFTREAARTCPASPSLHPEGLAGSRRPLCSLPRVTAPSGGSLPPLDTEGESGRGALCHGAPKKSGHNFKRLSPETSPALGLEGGHLEPGDDPPEITILRT